jgi:hypothetical protein
VTAAIRRYREAMRSFAGQTTLAVWYARADIAELREQFGSQLSGREQKRADQDVTMARTRDSLQALSKLTRLMDGRPRIVPDPPLVVPLADLIPAQADRARLQAGITGLIAGYRRTPETDRRYLLEQFQFADRPARWVGVGSVGTRCWIVLVLGRDHSGPAVLAGEGGGTVRPGGLRRDKPIRQPRPAGSRRAAAHAGRQRHLPRLAAQR